LRPQLFGLAATLSHISGWSTENREFADHARYGISLLA
jgi:hypothetical protein